MAIPDWRRRGTVSASGVALHVGRILYGNIGGGNRLDFTCIGPAVNLAARLEKSPAGLVARSWHPPGLCRNMRGAAGPIWASFPIAGFSKASAVYGLLDETPAA